SFEMQNFDPDAQDWRQGQLSFESQPWPEVIAEVERQLNVEITYPDSMKTKNFKGILELSQKETALNSLTVPFELDWKAEEAGKFRIFAR
ncbi:MAG: FecR domain-containing protein, partial [Bacteroidota bacterium]